MMLQLLILLNVLHICYLYNESTVISLASATAAPSSANRIGSRHMTWQPSWQIIKSHKSLLAGQCCYVDEEY